MKNENTNSAKPNAKPFRYGVLSFVGCLSVTMAVGLHSSIAVAEGEEYVTGDATWTYQDAAGSEFHVSMSIGDNDGSIRSWGTAPPSSDFPLELTNSDGETLTVDLTSTGGYSYEASIEISSLNAGACAQRACNGTSCYATPGFAWNCGDNGVWCWGWKCSSGGSTSGGKPEFIEVLSAAP